MLVVFVTASTEMDINEITGFLLLYSICLFDTASAKAIKSWSLQFVIFWSRKEMKKIFESFLKLSVKLSLR